MPILYQHQFLPADCIANPKALYVFGDNLKCRGNAGQAIIRGQPNAVGLFTKKSPSEYLTDADYELVLEASKHRRHRLELHHKRGGIIVWPLANIGTGLAALQDHAPKIAIYWNGFLNHFDMDYHIRSRRI